MTFSQYLAYKPPPGFRDELIHGEVRLSPSAKAEHQHICKRLERLLDAAINAEFVAQRDTTIYVSGDEGPRPDVFVIAKDRWNKARASAPGYPEGVPELVIEVRSASNSDPEFDQKRAVYFSDGRCLAFWVVNPDARSATVFTPTASPQVVSHGSIRLPGELGLPVAFEEIFS
jgi:Uma2 family endonuclease